MHIYIYSFSAGQERYRTITTAYYRGAMGFILMYDITNEESYKAVADWYVHVLSARLDSRFCFLMFDLLLCCQVL